MKIYRIQPIYFDLTRIKKLYFDLSYFSRSACTRYYLGSVGSNLIKPTLYLLKFKSLFLIHTSLLLQDTCLLCVF